ncbi:MAG: transglutaminase family protein [Planctomycetes bacterium]|nr:transglutaminase family protein [Planctomycetota bacterium]
MNEFDAAIREHDAKVAALGLEIWIGGEPTFTDRTSFDAAWNFAALGADKEERAQRMLALRAVLYPGCIILRTLGRQYPGEEKPRWSYGLYRRRDGKPLWQGPPDPLMLKGLTSAPPDAHVRLRDGLAAALTGRGYSTFSFDTLDGSARLAFTIDASRIMDKSDARLSRPSIHGRKIPEAGAIDELAAEGVFLLMLTLSEGIVSLELPALPDVGTFAALLTDVAHSASGLAALVVEGFPPPVDASVAFATYTPDPAVVENNMAPAPDLATFLEWNRELYDAASQAGLSSSRMLFNGLVADSGGGGHLTLGGPSPEQSPFFLHPQVLPQLIRYFNRHPSLSYLFAVDAVGSSSQSPRADEGVRESFEELQTALELVSRIVRPSPETLWRALAPFMADRTGNSHRAEINMEKLWNPWLPGRGRLGVIEFRALRMARTPERGAALGALLRAIVAMLAKRTAASATRDWSLVDWGAELHDRFALPFFLKRDLQDVLASLGAESLGLAPPITELLLDDNDRAFGTFELGACVLTLKRAVEFWPLVGDAASQESRGARLMDSSSQRLELVLRARSGKPADLGNWVLCAGGVQYTPSSATDASGEALVTGIRYRAFVPQIGLHPTVLAQTPLKCLLLDTSRQEAHVLTLHEWRPDGQAYPELPTSELDSARRRNERVRIAPIAWPGTSLPPPPPGALSPWCLDLRRC